MNANTKCDCGHKYTAHYVTGECNSCECRKFTVNPKRAARNKARRDRDSVMRDMGLTKVRGALGGVYWE